jgi:NTE family protein
MKRLLIFLFLLATIPLTLCAQSVGLVMSGGGARGLAHIGVIKMLEENNIPIDYVAGTSMGAIVAALYSMGYTPDEMDDILNRKSGLLGISGLSNDCRNVTNAAKEGNKREKSI